MLHLDRLPDDIIYELCLILKKDYIILRDVLINQEGIQKYVNQIKNGYINPFEELPIDLLCLNNEKYNFMLHKIDTGIRHSYKTKCKEELLYMYRHIYKLYRMRDYTMQNTLCVSTVLRIINNRCIKSISKAYLPKFEPCMVPDIIIQVDQLFLCTLNRGNYKYEIKAYNNWKELWGDIPPNLKNNFYRQHNLFQLIRPVRTEGIVGWMYNKFTKILDQLIDDVRYINKD